MSDTETTGNESTSLSGNRTTRRSKPFTESSTGVEEANPAQAQILLEHSN